MGRVAGQLEGDGRKPRGPAHRRFLVRWRPPGRPAGCAGAGRTALADESLSQVARLLSTAARRLGLSPAAECL